MRVVAVTTGLFQCCFQTYIVQFVFPGSDITTDAEVKLTCLVLKHTESSETLSRKQTSKHENDKKNAAIIYFNNLTALLGL